LLDERLATQKPLTDADVSRLYAQYIVSRDAETITRIQERLLGLLRETSEVICQTGTHANQFTRSLENHAQRLKQPDAASSLHAVLGDLLTETQKMSAVNLTLARQLDTRAQEVQTLTQRLERAEAEALNDSLTGLLNRRGFEQALAELAAQSVAGEGTSLLLADIDRFKDINDTHGHPVGDQVLRGVAKVLRARIKGADIAARVGGDEFAILLPNTAKAGAITLAEQIRAALLQARLRRINSDQHVGQVSVSIGVAHCGEGTLLDRLLQTADTALYTAKREGRNRVRAAD
jgi:diguanylate cyclase